MYEPSVFYIMKKLKEGQNIDLVLEKVEEEFAEVSGRLTRLEAFNQTDKAKELSLQHQAYLIDQERALRVYAEILAKRIDLMRYERIYN